MYYIIIVVFTGLSVGGAWGLSEGLRNIEAKSSSLLRVNAILNGLTKRGPDIGNKVGVLGIPWSVL